MKLNFNIICLIIFTISACTTKTVKIKNINKGKLKPSVTLNLIEEKKFQLDSNTAPKAQYTQLYKDSSGTRYFTFLNTYSNSIYFYDYNTLEVKKKISFDKKGSDGMIQPLGYHIKSLDSIYFFEKRYMELILANDKSQIYNRTSLLKGQDIKNSSWALNIPQFFPQTVNPFIETSDELLLNGQYMFTIPHSIINSFKFTLRINIKSNEVSYSNIYPSSLYGHNFNWNNNLLTQVFSELHPDGNKLVHSFPVSHDLYVSNINTSGSYSKVYGGSNFAGTIQSVNKTKQKASRQDLMSHFLKNDEYAAIKYDKYRKVYYRFLRKGISNLTPTTHLNDKPICIIIMDKNFNYLGEKVIGTRKKWYWQNSFVTKEGLNIEYLDDDNLEELWLTLKIFTIKKI